MWLSQYSRLMNNINNILEGLSYASLDAKSFLDLIGDDNYTEHRPLPEDVKSPNDNWVCFEGKDWFLEFVNGVFVYLAVPRVDLLSINIDSKFIFKIPEIPDFNLDTYLLLGNRSLFENKDLLPNRFSPIISELLK